MVSCRGSTRRLRSTSARLQRVVVMKGDGWIRRAPAAPMSHSEDVPAESATARLPLFRAWAGELAHGRARVARLERRREKRPLADRDASQALEELRLTYEELSVAEEEL